MKYFYFKVDMLKGVKVEVGVGPHNSKSDESSRMSHQSGLILILLDFLLLQHSLDFWFDHIELKLILRVVSANLTPTQFNLLVVELVEPLWHIQPSNPTIKLWKLTFSCPNKRWRPKRGERMKGIYMEIQSKWWVISDES